MGRKWEWRPDEVLDGRPFLSHQYPIAYPVEVRTQDGIAR
jgi:hypothetical protein